MLALHIIIAASAAGNHALCPKLRQELIQRTLQLNASPWGPQPAALLPQQYLASTAARRLHRQPLRLHTASHLSNSRVHYRVIQKATRWQERMGGWVMVQLSCGSTNR